MLVLSFPPSTTPNLTHSLGGWMGNQAGNSEQRKEDETVFLAHASAYASTSASTSASASAAVFAYTLVVVVVAVVVPDELAVFRTKYCIMYASPLASPFLSQLPSGAPPRPSPARHRETQGPQHRHCACHARLLPPPPPPPAAAHARPCVVARSNKGPIRAVARVAPPPELAKGRWLAGRLAGWLPQFSCVLLSREPWAPPPPLPPPPPPPQDMACGPNGKAAARRPGPQAGLHCNPDMGMGGCASSMMPQPRGCTSRFRATLLCTCECKCQGSLHSLVGDAARFGQQPTTSKGGGGVRCFA
ncbi:hypothetical protein PCL_11997 [Purpureocillium lilacinum]|uniref:Uncharacterized protein n=1 Tax=Purpureocillium lilacinum TaxID=33203 RepID=A0A2U3EBS0_PURLI|nr:hypothetical protein PCL_11997 [Purpureocillium lilacinum]